MQLGIFQLSEGMKQEVSDISQEARFSFYKMTGITPQEQVNLEAVYDHLDLDTHKVNQYHPLIPPFWSTY
jgi:hypothetical protein